MTLGKTDDEQIKALKIMEKIAEGSPNILTLDINLANTHRE